MKNKKPIFILCEICENRILEEEAEMLEDGRKICSDCEEQYAFRVGLENE